MLEEVHVSTHFLPPVFSGFVLLDL